MESNGLPSIRLWILFEVAMTPKMLRMLKDTQDSKLVNPRFRGFYSKDIF